MEEKELTVIERFLSPTPKFFRKLRLGGGLLTTISLAIVSFQFQNFEIHDIVYQLAGYLALAGFIAMSVSQFAVDNKMVVVNPITKETKQADTE